MFDGLLDVAVVEGERSEVVVDLRLSRLQRASKAVVFGSKWPTDLMPRTVAKIVGGRM